MYIGKKNFGLIEPYFDAIDSSDLDRLIACFTHDAEFQLAGVTPVLVGHEAIRSFFAARWHSFSTQKAIRRRCFLNGLEVITVAEIKVTIPELGEDEVILQIAQRYLFEPSGLITKLTDFFDLTSAVRAPNNDLPPRTSADIKTPGRR